MRKFRLFMTVVKRCQADKITIGLLICFFLVSLIIMLVEPCINNYGDAMWYTFVSATTIGFGDEIVTTTLSRLLTVLITLFALIWTAIFSGVIVTVYLEVIERTEKETVTQFMDKLEHLSELDKSELEELENRVKEVRKKYER